MKVVIPGVPIPQIRHRYSLTANKKVYVYDPLARDKALIRERLRKEAGPDFTPMTFGWASFVFWMPIPKGFAVTDKELMAKYIIAHRKKPDVDNLVKFYLDVLTGVLINDDCRVNLGYCVKCYSPNPRTEIKLIETQEKEILDNERLCCPELAELFSEQNCVATPDRADSGNRDD